MKLYTSLIITFISFSFSLISIEANAQVTNPKYDKALADSMGADAYGMKMYVLVILKTGEAKLDKSKQDSLFMGHLNNIVRLAGIGKLVVSGPIVKNEKQYRGIFILNVKTLDEAKTLLETDPAISNHLLDTEMFQWYGSAALPIYLPYHNSVKMKDF